MEGTVVKLWKGQRSSYGRDSSQAMEGTVVKLWKGQWSNYGRDSGQAVEGTVVKLWKGQWSGYGRDSDFITQLILPTGVVFSHEGSENPTGLFQ